MRDAKAQLPHEDLGAVGELEFKLTHFRKNGARPFQENLLLVDGPIGRSWRSRRRNRG
jgi:hypothetical protein